MLYMIGPVLLQIAPLNATDISREATYPFAEHQVLGASPLFENMGDGAQTRTIRGCTFPKVAGFEGGAEALLVLEAVRAAGTPMPLIRGDGAALGWHIVTSIKESGASLWADGVPQELTFEVSLTQCDAAFASDILGFFGAIL